MAPVGDPLEGARHPNAGIANSGNVASCVKQGMYGTAEKTGNVYDRAIVRFEDFGEYPAGCPWFSAISLLRALDVTSRLSIRLMDRQKGLSRQGQLQSQIRSSACRVSGVARVELRVRAGLTTIGL